MIIILEGNDNTGKTTIGKILSQKLTIPYYHQTPEELKLKDLNSQEISLWAAAKFKTLVDLPLLNQIDLILDRFYLSEEVYSKVLKRKKLIDFYEIEDKLMNADVFLILLVAPSEILIKRGITEFDPSTINEISENYIKTFKESRLPKIKIDTSVLTPEEIVNRIINWIYRYRKRKVYLAGKIQTGIKNKEKTWRNKIKNGLRNKYIFFDPLEADLFEAKLNRDKRIEVKNDIVTQDFNSIVNSDIFILKASASIGAGVELFLAYILRKKIYIFDSESIFADSLCTKKFKNLTELIRFMEEN